MCAQAKRDENRIATLLGVSNVDGTTPVVLFADPVTHRLLVSSVGGITTPGTTTNNAIVRWDGTDGSAIQDYTSNAPTISDTGVLTMANTLAMGANDLTLTGSIGRDTDNELNWGTDDSLAIVIGGTTLNIVSISTGAGDNDKLVTQGYVDDATPAAETWATTLAAGNTTGTNDVLFGSGSTTVLEIDDIPALTGAGNSIAGSGAGAALTSGVRNTLFGFEAGLTAVNDNDNTFIGYRAGKITIGQRNTAVGSEALDLAFSGNDNVAVGYRTISAALSGGNDNTAIGSNSQLLNNAGSANTSVGKKSLDSLTSANFNTAIGSESMTDNQTGASNTAVGYFSLNNTTGASNTAVGESAGKLITTGVGNIILGHDADPSANDANNEFVAGSATEAIIDVYFGEGPLNASPVAYTIHGGGGSGSDIAGAILNLAGGKGTGNAVGGSIILQTAVAGSTGTTLQSLVTRLTIDSFGHSTFAAGSTPLSVASTPATPHPGAITATGGLGGNTTIASTGVGGIGGGFAFIAGNGGVASAATTASTGGVGGAYEITTGVGGATSVVGSGSETGGDGGLLALLTGNGGAVTTGTGTNTGGDSGAIVIITGAGGAAQDGTDTGGASGSISITTGIGGASDTGGASGDINLTIGAVGSGGSPVAGAIKLTGAIQLILGSDADGDTYYRDSGTLTRLAKGSDTEVLTLASGVPTWAAPGGGGDAINPTYSTTFETEGRFTEEVVSTGAIVFSVKGLEMTTGATGGSHAQKEWPLGTTGANNVIYVGDPIVTITVNVDTIGTDLDAFFGIGEDAGTWSTGDFVETIDHIGFKFERTSSGDLNVTAHQSDGTGPTESATLTTLVANDVIDLVFKVNGTTSVDYYFSKNGAAQSSATNLSGDVPSAADHHMLFGVGNKAAASATEIDVIGASYTRTA